MDLPNIVLKQRRKVFVGYRPIAVGNGVDTGHLTSPASLTLGRNHITDVNKTHKHSLAVALEQHSEFRSGDQYGDEIYLLEVTLRYAYFEW